MTLLPASVRTLGGMFDHAAERYPGKTIGSFPKEESVDFEELARSGREVAHRLLAAGIEPGMPVAVLIRSNLELLRALGGVAAAGAVIVPLSVSVGLSAAYLARLGHVVEDCGVRFAVVDETYAEHFAELLPHIRTITLGPGRTDTATGGDAGPAGLPVVDEEDLALIQYTSGSTSNPRGVALTHRNVLAGIRALHEGVRPRADDVLCHWLPLSHDMGLFSTLAGVAAGIDIRISAPQDFVKHPEEWLREFCAFGADITVGPNFSYRYLIDAIEPDDVAEYDLSSLRVALNGAEPIDPELVSEFGRHFAAAGLAPEAMTPCYGLAEATLAVTFAPVDERAAVDWVDRSVLNSTGHARPAEPRAPGARGIVSCGIPVSSVDVRITDSGTDLPERTVGEIEIRGVPVMRGYFGEKGEAGDTGAVDGGTIEWCSTGDLGYLADSRLYVTGRRKEMMILGGQNYYPQDIEDAIRNLPGVHKGHAIAVVLPPDPGTGTPERIGVLAEVAVVSPPYGPTVSAIREAAAGELAGASVDVVLLRRNALPRTTSGKFQRLLTRGQLLEGTLKRVLVQVAAGAPLPPDEGSAPSPA
ncbi:AMP-binding protein [Streptomyces sp. NPDC087850]|uniref:AMP-binding protein n=1 Tax=Streptomyces sp. NPDC087850 TaxID=3365809 RepID=UPI00381FB4A7